MTGRLGQQVLKLPIHEARVLGGSEQSIALDEEIEISKFAGAQLQAFSNSVDHLWGQASLTLKNHAETSVRLVAQALCPGLL